MTNNLDDWLFRGGDDNMPCEPEVNNDGSITCKRCGIVECPYWADMNEVNYDNN